MTTSMAPGLKWTRYVVGAPPGTEIVTVVLAPAARWPVLGLTVTVSAEGVDVQSTGPPAAVSTTVHVPPVDGLTV